MGLVLGFVHQHSGQGQVDFIEYINEYTSKPITRSHSSSVYVTLQKRGYLRSTPGTKGDCVSGAPIKNYYLTEQGLKVVRKF